MRLDISPLSEVAQRLDASAALRSFVALLAPLLVVWNLGVIISAVELFAEVEFDDLFFNSDGLILASLVILIALVAAFAPLWFVISDWAARRPGARYLSAIAGTALGALGFALGGGLIGMFAFLLEKEFEPPVGEDWRLVLSGGSIAALIGLGSWLLSESKRVATLVTWASTIAALLLALGPAVWLLLDPRLNDGAWKLALMWISLSALTVWLVRAVQLRIVLASDCPRPLLLGGFHRHGFWIRMAFLAGLPSSLWSARAMLTPAFWTLILARPLVYVGVAILVMNPGDEPREALPFGGIALIILGHAAFYVGKRLAARAIWNPRSHHDLRAPILFLRSFEDDQLDFRRPLWNLPGLWLDLWSFRNNVDQVLVDELAQYGPVVALGRPGETTAPFGAMRYYSSPDDWQSIIVDTARRSQAIVIVAGDSPGVRWEFKLIADEQLVERTLLLFRPGLEALEVNRRALTLFPRGESHESNPEFDSEARPVAWLQSSHGPHLLTDKTPRAASYVVALRAHFNWRKGGVAS